MLTLVGYDRLAGARGHHSPSRAKDGIAIVSSGRKVVYAIKQDRATQPSPTLQPILLPRASSMCHRETCYRSSPWGHFLRKSHRRDLPRRRRRRAVSRHPQGRLRRSATSKGGLPCRSVPGAAMWDQLGDLVSVVVCLAAAMVVVGR